MFVYRKLNVIFIYMNTKTVGNFVMSYLLTYSIFIYIYIYICTNKCTKYIENIK